VRGDGTRLSAGGTGPESRREAMGGRAGGKDGRYFVYIRSTAAAVVKWAPRGADCSRCPTANRRRLGFL